MKIRYTRTDTLYLLAILAVVLAFLAPAWRQPESIWVTPGAVYSDLAISHWPIWWRVSRSVREHGQIPLWRPEIMGGAPLLGNPLTALFYPPNWLLVALPLNPAFHVLLALHLYVAGVAMYGLARRAAGSTPFAAFIGGLCYALTPKLIAHVGAGHVGLSEAFAWLPASLWLLHNATTPPLNPPRQVRGGEAHICSPPAKYAGGAGGGLRSWHYVLACGGTLALTYLADPRIAFLSALSLAAYALYRLIGRWQTNGIQDALRLALRLLLVPLTAVAFSAVQALPTLELMRSLTRSTLGVQEAGFLSLPWRYTIGYLLADWGGFHEWMTYLGLVPVGLGLLALFKSRAPARWFWLGLAALSLIYALGTNTPIYPLLYRLLPILGWVRVPSRALLLVALSGSVLAAYGADALWTKARTPRARYLANLLSIGTLFAFAGLGLGFVWLYPGRPPPALILLVIIGAATSLAWILSLRPGVPRALVQTLVTAALLTDLFAVGHSLLELRPTDVVNQEGLATARWAAAQQPPLGRPYRIYSPSLSIPQHTGARFGIELVDGVDPSQLRWVAHYVGMASGCPASGYGVTLPYIGRDADPSTACREAIPDARLLGQLNACLVVADYPIKAPGLVFEGQLAGGYHYRNERCLPRAFAMTRTEPVSSWQEAQALLAGGHDPEQSALVEDDRALDGPTGWQPALVRDRSPNRLAVHAETTEPTLLVLSEVWYPGWEAAVDGVEQPIVRVNGLLRGVYLTPGTHTIVWRYRPASLRWGAAITLCALAGSLLSLLRMRRSRRKAP